LTRIPALGGDNCAGARRRPAAKYPRLSAKALGIGRRFRHQARHRDPHLEPAGRPRKARDQAWILSKLVDRPVVRRARGVRRRRQQPRRRQRHRPRRARGVERLHLELEAVGPGHRLRLQRRVRHRHRRRHQHLHPRRRLAHRRGRGAREISLPRDHHPRRRGRPRGPTTCSQDRHHRAAFALGGLFGVSSVNEQEAQRRSPAARKHAFALPVSLRQAPIAVNHVPPLKILCVPRQGEITLC